jgi:hypothetical protein
VAPSARVARKRGALAKAGARRGAFARLAAHRPELTAPPDSSPVGAGAASAYGAAGPRVASADAAAVTRTMHAARNWRPIATAA